MTLLTHSDPGELLPGDTLRFFWIVTAADIKIDPLLTSVLTPCGFRNMLYPKMAREAGHYFETWVARWWNCFTVPIICFQCTNNPSFSPQVPGSVKGPGSVTAEAIFDWAEQVEMWKSWWRVFTSEDRLFGWEFLIRRAYFSFNLLATAFYSRALFYIYIQPASFYNCC